MRWPHERALATLRSQAFWLASLLSAWAALRTPGLGPRVGGLAIAGAVLAAAVFYQYARWLTALDARFRRAHPRKIRATTLLGFYELVVLAAVIAAASPWVVAFPGKSRLENAAWWLAIPCLLAGAAGALRGGRDGGAIE